MTQSRMSEMLLGALVADAACLGTHWLYDAERIGKIAARQNGQAAFTPLNAENYEGVKGFFAHGARQDGMLTQIGEVLRLTIQSMNANDGAFDVTKYQAAFASHFGAGGPYKGYIDRPTKAALENIAAEKSPTGIDDDQTPAMSRLPAIFAAYYDKPELTDIINTSMEVTNVNDIAGAYNATFASVLGHLVQNVPLNEALEVAAKSADPSIKDGILGALTTSETNSSDFAGLEGMMGRACHMPQAGPVIFHILKHTKTYSEAIERNVRAGGDSAGRSILIGAIMAYVHGVGTPDGIPLSWVLQLDDSAEIWNDCKRLGSA